MVDINLEQYNLDSILIFLVFLSKVTLSYKFAVSLSISLCVMITIKDEQSVVSY